MIVLFVIGPSREETETEQVLCAISKLSTLFWKIIQASWNKLSETLTIGIKILFTGRPKGSWVIDQENILHSIFEFLR